MLRLSPVARLLTLGFVAAAAAGAVLAQDVKFFRIGTGGTAGTYYPIGGLIANAISNPPGSRACADGGSCGAPGVVATAVASNGSVANINGIQSGQLESGFTQSDVAYWAYTGTGVYEGKLKIAKMDVDENQAIPAQFGIRSIPTLILFKGGQVAATISGARPKAQLAAFIDQQLAA